MAAFPVSRPNPDSPLPPKFQACRAIVKLSYTNRKTTFLDPRRCGNIRGWHEPSSRQQDSRHHAHNAGQWPGLAGRSEESGLLHACTLPGLRQFVFRNAGLPVDSAPNGCFATQTFGPCGSSTSSTSRSNAQLQLARRFAIHVPSPQPAPCRDDPDVPAFSLRAVDR
jgi:hypothetical protein